MTRSNRVANRVILILLGLVSLAAAAALALPFVPERVLAFRLPTLTTSPIIDGIVAGAAVIVVVLAIAWMVTRGRGRMRTAIRGDLSVDARVADELIRDALAPEPDAVAASTSAFRVRGTTVLRIHVEARRGADLRRLTDAVRTAVDELDLALGTAPESRLPVLVHVSSGLRASLARENRVA